MEHGAKMQTGEIVCGQRKSVPVPLCPPQILMANVRESCSAVGITAWAKERPKILQTWITIMYDVKYGLLSDTWYTVCTMIGNYLRTVVPNLIQGLPPAVRQRLCFNKMELMHCMGNMTHSDWRRQFYCIYVVYGVWSLDTLRHCSVKYPKQQRSQAICCVIFKIYRVRRNQIMGTLFTNLLSL